MKAAAELADVRQEETPKQPDMRDAAGFREGGCRALRSEQHLRTAQTLFSVIEGSNLPKQGLLQPYRPSQQPLQWKGRRWDEPERKKKKEEAA